MDLNILIVPNVLDSVHIEMEGGIHVYSAFS